MIAVRNALRSSQMDKCTYEDGQSNSICIRHLMMDTTDDMTWNAEWSWATGEWHKPAKVESKHMKFYQTVCMFHQGCTSVQLPATKLGFQLFNQ